MVCPFAVPAGNLDLTGTHATPHRPSPPPRRRTVVAAGAASTVTELAVKTANRHVKWVDMDAHGHYVLDLTAERAQLDYCALSDKEDPDAAARHQRSYRTLPGRAGTERVDQPVR